MDRMKQPPIEAAFSYLKGLTAYGSKPGLSRTRELLRRLGNPQNRLHFVHITGTNGKGSTAAMLACVLRHAGYCVGRYTSPALVAVNERICVDDAPIPDDDLAAAVRRTARQADAMADHPTEFEFVTAMALDYFAGRRCDIVVLEVGMGGALDSTNVIGPPEAAVFTRISLDHTRILGSTLAEIAAVKAGILKAGSAAAVSEQAPEVRAVLAQRAAELGVPLRWCDFSQLHCTDRCLGGQQFDYRTHRGLFLSLLGAHQLKNAALAVETVELLRARGWEISDTALHDGLAAARWPGRFELLLRHGPLFIADGGHNPDCAAALAAALRDLFPGKKFVFIVGVMADKDYPAMLAAVQPLAVRFVAVRPDNPRALPAEELAAFLRAQGAEAETAASPEAGVERAMELAGPDGAVCSFGSLYMTGAVRAQALKHRKHPTIERADAE